MVGKGGVTANPDRDLGAVLRALEEAAPRLYSRWSAKAWRLVCQGPASRLWDSLADGPDGRAALEDYLFLAREAIGMQYLTATRPEDLEPGAIGHGFLAVMLCETLPRLLPAASAADRARALAQVWNAGERLVGRPVWLDRYLAARLPELRALSDFEAFLGRVVSEGLDELPPAAWEGGTRTSVVDPSRFDRAFLPGDMHLATPSVVCVHDRRDDARHVAVLLRRASTAGPSMCLGSTPCLGAAAGIAAVTAPVSFLERSARDSGVGEAMRFLSVRAGFVVFAHALSQRLWIVESER